MSVFHGLSGGKIEQFILDEASWVLFGWSSVVLDIIGVMLVLPCIGLALSLISVVWFDSLRDVAVSFTQPERAITMINSAIKIGCRMTLLGNIDFYIYYCSNGFPGKRDL